MSVGVHPWVLSIFDSGRGSSGTDFIFEIINFCCKGNNGCILWFHLFATILLDHIVVLVDVGTNEIIVSYIQAHLLIILALLNESAEDVVFTKQ